MINVVSGNRGRPVRGAGWQIVGEESLAVTKRCVCASRVQQTLMVQLNGTPTVASLPPRSVRFHRSEIGLGNEIKSCGYIGLVPSMDMACAGSHCNPHSSLQRQSPHLL